MSQSIKNGINYGDRQEIDAKIDTAIAQSLHFGSAMQLKQAWREALYLEPVGNASNNHHDFHYYLETRTNY
jgi:hypothetical protein